MISNLPLTIPLSFLLLVTTGLLLWIAWRHLQAATRYIRLSPDAYRAVRRQLHAHLNYAALCAVLALACLVWWAWLLF